MVTVGLVIVFCLNRRETGILIQNTVMIVCGNQGAVRQKEKCEQQFTNSADVISASSFVHLPDLPAENFRESKGHCSDIHTYIVSEVPCEVNSTPEIALLSRRGVSRTEVVVHPEKRRPEFPAGVSNFISAACFIASESSCGPRRNHPIPSGRSIYPSRSCRHAGTRSRSVFPSPANR